MGSDASSRRLGLVAVLVLAAGATAVAETKVANLGPVDWGSAPRWRDMATYLYASEKKLSYDYAQGVATLAYEGSAPTLAGTLALEGLKPNFAYQVKLNGKPTYTWGSGGDDWANERLGYAGRWWLKQFDAETGIEVGGWNSSDSEYEYWKARGFTDGTYDYVFEGYLLFAYVATDAAGNAAAGLWLDSSFHVLWKTSQRSPGANDSVPTIHTVIASSASDWYAQSYPTTDVGLYAEWEPGRALPGELALAPGAYNVRIFLTEESFHETAADSGQWATVMTHDDIRFTIPGPNQPPVAADDAYRVDEDGQLSVAAPGVLANDTDPESDPLTAALVADVAHGSLALGADGSFVYTPAPDYAGTDSFTYKANDGAADSNAATVTLTVDPVNDPPVASDDAASTPEGVAVTIDVLANDTDPDADALSVASVTQPAHGVATNNGADVTYAPESGFTGDDAFTYIVSDGQGGADLAFVTVTVGGANAPPTPPQGLVAVAGATSVTLNWDDNAEPEGDLVGYNVYRATASGAYDFGAPIASVAQSACVDAGVASGTTCYYVVKAVDTAGLESEPSQEASATPDDTLDDAYAVEAPLVTFGTVGGDGIVGTTESGDGLVQTLTEVPNGKAGMASLQVEYALHTSAGPADVTQLVLRLEAGWTNLDGGADPLVVAIWNGAAWEDITADLQDGSFTPAANPQNYVNAQGDVRVLFRDTAPIRKEGRDTLTIDLLCAVVVALPPDTDPPAPPTGLAAAPGDSQVSLDWDDNLEGDVVGYHVRRSTTPGGPYARIDPALVTASLYVDATAVNGTTYYYVVTAVDALGGESGPSAEASATPGAQPTVHVQSIEMALQQAGKNWKAVATVVVRDQSGAPAAGATVVGDWLYNGALLQSGAAATADGAGSALLTSPPKKARSGDVFTFRVTGVVLGGHVYEPAQNVETEDSIAVP